MSLLTDDINLAMTDAFTVAGQKFIWKGNPFDCVVNAEQNTLVTSKSLFGANGYPQQGDTIILNNKTRQITGIGNAVLEFVGGGLTSDSVFVDDPVNPSLSISFSQFIGK